MGKKGLQLRCLGARGSVPVSGQRFNFYGGATSSYLITYDDQRIILDGGTGLVDSKSCDFSKGEKEVILISHLHLDHIAGLPYCTGLNNKNHKVDIFVPSQAAVDGIMTIFSPPYWPITLKDYPADVDITPIPEVLKLPDCRITHTTANHPGECLIFKIEHKERTIVYASDYEHDNGPYDEALIALAKGADILVYDGSYSEDEYEIFRGYGHSTPKNGVRIAKEAGVKTLVISHHPPDHDDAFVEQMEKDTKKLFENVIFAYTGMVI